MSAANVLFVDDDQAASASLMRALSRSGLGASFQVAPTETKALELFRSQPIDVVVMDLSIDDRRGVESGFDLLKNFVEISQVTRIIVLTGHGTTEHGVRALGLGAASFLEKPADIPHLAALIKEGLRQAELRKAYAKLLEAGTAGDAVERQIIGKSSAISRVIEAVKYAAHTNQSVLITGETGTGKGHTAAVLHRLSKRREKHFVRYQPSFGTADLVNSDLFGHVKGAFTGAQQDRTGLIAEAEGGSLFLDEIDELPVEVQVSLLGLLQDRVYRPVGGTREIKTDFRLITATNRNIRDCVAQGKVRQDFFHRIAHFQIELPPLRERREDISLLAEHVLARVREQEQLNVFHLEPAAIQALESYSWPGNVREFEAVLEGAAYHANYKNRQVIQVEDIQVGNGGPTSAVPAGNGESVVATHGSFTEQVEAFKVKLIAEAIARNGGNQAQAAKDLQLDRSTLRRVLGRRE